MSSDCARAPVAVPSIIASTIATREKTFCVFIRRTRSSKVNYPHSEGTDLKRRPDNRRGGPDRPNFQTLPAALLPHFQFPCAPESPPDPTQMSDKVVLSSLLLRSTHY